jgi:hypothetical protein
MLGSTTPNKGLWAAFIHEFDAIEVASTINFALPVRARTCAQNPHDV